jgi:hypothetical protein
MFPPKRIICLTEETVEALYRLGEKWRGKLRTITPRMVEELILVSQPNGRYTSARVPYALLGKQVVRQRLLMDRLAGLGYGGWATRDNEDEAQRLVRLLPVVAGFSLRRLIGEAEDEPRARFVTDPFGVREVFRLRDVPPGKQRRAALLHWVRAHWRQRRQPTEADKAFGSTRSAAKAFYKRSSSSSALASFKSPVSNPSVNQP